MIQSILFILLISVGVGLPLTLLIAPKHNVVGRLGLSYLFGIGFFTLVMFITNLIGLKFNLLHIIFILVGMSFPLFFLSLKRVNEYGKTLRNKINVVNFDKVEKVTILGILFLIVSSLVNTLYWPVYIWDAITLYDFRGKIFSSLGFITTSINSSDLLGYPLLTSLSHSIIYITGGANPQFIYTLFYLSLSLIFYGLLRDFLSTKQSLIYVLLLLAIPGIYLQSTIAYTNLPYMIYFSLGLIYAFVYFNNKNQGYLYTSAFLIGLSTWVRSAEPFWLIAVFYMALISIINKHFFDSIKYLILVLFILLPWKIFQNVSMHEFVITSGFVNTQVLVSNVFNFRRWNEVVIFLYNNVVKSWGWIFVTFIVSLIYTTLTKRRTNVWLFTSLIVVFFLILIGGTFIFSFAFYNWKEIPDSASRMAMIFYPLFVYNIALVAGKRHEFKK